MLFEIKTRAASNKIKPNYKSAVVKFLVKSKEMEKEFESFEDLLGVKFNKVLKNDFLKNESKKLELINNTGRPDLIFTYKIDLEKSFNVDYFRDTLSELIQNLKDKPVRYLDLMLPEFDHFSSKFKSERYYYQSVAEGVLLGNYTFDSYKTEEKKEKELTVIFHSSNPVEFKKSITVATNLVNSVYFSRDLVNEPAITLYPAEFVKRLRDELSKAGVKVKAYDEKELKKRKMNAILAVGGASIHPPRLIILHYKPKQKAKRKITLVGKGVTYDSGGLSIKPTDGMVEMKADMAGAATVAGTIKAAAMLKLPVELTGVIPAVENMISGNSYKPGDIVRTSSGKTIEVKNTDAEGRIVLADALEFASKGKPDEIIDFATLTGAIAVALGLYAAGIFSKNDAMTGLLTRAGEITYEKVWRMPFWDEYKKLLDSDIADISNLGPRWGGAITAGKFLEHFVDENISWMHVDLAGPAIKNDFKSYTKKFDTGFGVRLMVEYFNGIIAGI